MSFYLQILALVVLYILLVDWLWINKITGTWMNKLWVVIAPVCLFRGYQLFHTNEMRVAFLAIVFTVTGIAFLLTGLNKLVRRPFRGM